MRLDIGHFLSAYFRKMLTDFAQVRAKMPTRKFECSLCDYKCSYKRDYDRHLNSRKHQNAYTNWAKCLHKCECGKEFNHRQSFHRHKKSCTYSKNMDFAVESTCDHSNAIEVSVSGDEYSDDNNGISAFMKIQKEQMEMLLEKQEQQQLTMMSMMLSQFKEMIPLVGNTTNNMNNTNFNNNTFNMNVFLNETCKDAMNLDDFVKTLQFGMDDLLYTAENGYVEGVGKIILRGLDALEVEKRPIHCSDMKREVMYIKKDGVWAKDTNDNEQLRETILLVGRMNIRNLPPWMKAHPSFTQATSRFSDVYAEIVMNTMVESVEMARKYSTKIIKNVAKHVHIDRYHTIVRQR